MNLSERLKNVKYDGYIERVIEKLRHAKLIVVFGAGERAIFLARFLLERGIEVDSFWINQIYYKDNETIKIGKKEKCVKCYEKEIIKKQNVTLVLGVSKSIVNMSIFDRSNIDEVISISIGTREDYIIQKEFYHAHVTELDMLYDMLADNYSRECLYTHLCGRLTGRDIPFESQQCSDSQYIFDEFMVWGEKECFVDCGAYIGDSIEEFMRKIPVENVKEFIVYALEPDKNNYKQLEEKYKDNPQIKCLCIGAYSGKERLSFLEKEGVLSAISYLGDTFVEVDSIDCILGEEKATFIKMDVEGSELEALKGAKNQIIKNTPRLAICVYHKKEDLFEIPKLIMQYNSNYKLYLRLHSKMPTELTLFCIPKYK